MQTHPTYIGMGESTAAAALLLFHSSLYLARNVDYGHVRVPSSFPLTHFVLPTVVPSPEREQTSLHGGGGFFSKVVISELSHVFTSSDLFYMHKYCQTCSHCANRLCCCSSIFLFAVYS